MNHPIRLLVSAASIVAVVIGGSRVIGLLLDLMNQAQGKCDYLPCVWPWTYPSLAGFGLLAVAGTAILGWMLFDHGGPFHQRG